FTGHTGVPRRRVAEFFDEALQRVLAGHIGRVVISSDRYYRRGVVKIRLIELRFVVPPLAVEVHDVTELEEEAATVRLRRRQLLLHVVSDAVLCVGAVLGVPGVADRVEPHSSGGEDARILVGAQYVLQVQVKRVAAGRRRQRLGRRAPARTRSGGSRTG